MGGSIHLAQPWLAVAAGLCSFYRRAARAPGVYGVLEAGAYLPDDVPGVIIMTIEGARPALTVYNLSP
jgi:hypothetical protein